MGPFYTATERFDASAGPPWDAYLSWSGLAHVQEVVSLDPMLCPRLVEGILPDDWAHRVNEDFLGDYFTNLEYLVTRAGAAVPRNLLCVYRNPAGVPSPPDSRRFRLEGYDLVDVGGSTSALTNCGGFPLAFANSELSTNGLLPSLGRANEVQAALRAHYPDEAHARCDVWAIFRAVET